MFAGLTDRLRDEVIRLVDEDNSSFGYLKPELVSGLRFHNYRHPPNMVMWSGGISK